MLDHVFHVFTRKQDRKLFASYAKSFAAAIHLCQSSGDQAQHLISGVVAISIVEVLEMIDVHHRDGVGRLQTKQGFVISTPRWQSSEFVVIGENVRIFD